MTAACPIFGFTLQCTLHAQLDAAGEAALTDAFLAFAASRGLVCSGGFSGARWSMTVHSEAGQATEADRSAAEAWVRARPEIAAAGVGPLFDLDS
ncbi:MAG: 50S ribosome-binding protein YggL [Gemmatimonadaceae bacterium]